MPKSCAVWHPRNTSTARLLERKHLAPEMGQATPVATVHAFIEDELARTAGLAAQEQLPADQQAVLNALFRALLDEPRLQ